MVKLLILSLGLLSLVPSVVSANTVELFYDGFWSHHRAAKPVNKLIKRHKLAFQLSLSSIPLQLQDKLLDGYVKDDKLSKPDDYIIYIKEYDDSGQLIKEIGGGNEVLWNFTDNLYKKLDETSKRLLNNFIKDVSCVKSDFLSYKIIN